MHPIAIRLYKNNKHRGTPAMTPVSTHEVGDAEGNLVYRRITLRLIPFIFICYLFNYLDRVNVGFAKL
ncbi:putative 4-hydroxyphenylacetate permease, partial [Pseudomonas syringae pv. coryli]